jgi:hypothetical protein
VFAILILLKQLKPKGRDVIRMTIWEIKDNKLYRYQMSHDLFWSKGSK